MQHLPFACAGNEKGRRFLERCGLFETVDVLCYKSVSLTTAVPFARQTRTRARVIARHLMAAGARDGAGMSAVIWYVIVLHYRRPL